MQIRWAIPCRFAEVREGVGNFLGTGWDTVRVEDLPRQITFSVAINATVPEHELGLEEEISVEILDPAMEASDGGRIAVRLDDYPQRPPGRQPSFQVVVGVALEAAAYGQYSVNLTLQDRVTTVPIFVVDPTA